MTRKSARERRKPDQFSPSGSVDFETHNSKMAASKDPSTPLKRSNASSEELLNDLESLANSTPDKNMFESLINLVKKVVSENLELKSKVSKLEKAKVSSDKRLNHQYNRIVELETDLGKLNQYGRRNNIEVAGIPENVQQDQLENKVIEIMSAIDVDIKPTDIEACHRIGRVDRVNGSNGPRRTIIRFVNRKKCENIFRNKKKLANVDKNKLRVGKIYVNHSLCGMYRTIWWNCKKLHAAGRIHSFWVSGGIVRIKLREDSNSIPIVHQEDLRLEFPGFDFNAPIIRND